MSLTVVEVFAWVTAFVGVVLLYIPWHNNPTLPIESINHAGQWSILASTVLLLSGVLFTSGYQPRSPLPRRLQLPMSASKCVTSKAPRRDPMLFYTKCNFLNTSSTRSRFPLVASVVASPSIKSR